jgi:hypothetical protein
LNEQGEYRSIKVRNLFNELLADIAPILPVNSREVSLVRTHLEIAGMYAQKAIAGQETNQEIPILTGGKK